jgi:LysM repeat protein
MKIERILNIGMKKFKKILLALMFLTISWALHAEGYDSIGQKFVDGKRYIQYKVGAKETLYSLSKKYNTTVAAIEASNGGLIKGLQKDAEILIPVPNNAPKSAPVRVKVANNDKVKIDEVVQALHVVSSGETLYAISKKYSVSVDDIKKWNNLSTNEISLGQELKVSSPTGSSNVKVDLGNSDTQSSEKVNLGNKVGENAAGVGNVNPNEGQNTLPTDTKVDESKYTVDTSLYGEEVTETKTMGTITKVGVDQSKNLAQMDGIKPGTILMLVNPTNNKATFVRVIEGSAEGILVTSTVQKALGLSSESAPKVKVSYTK